MALSATAAECAEQLAHFFPLTRRIQINAEITASRPGGKKLRERVVLEFGGKDHAIFRSALPIEFDDHVSLASLNDGVEAEATVIAVQYHEGCKAVAVRFTSGSCIWNTER
ncbi:MAG TPA: hypothetical protein VLV88_06580 [Terriglobales bacterium]|nr:hypothetical protein [Terriglobales bacterium]